MPQPDESTAVAAPSFEEVGTGLNVYESPEPVEGVVKWLETPDDVIEFVSGGDVSDVVVVARGGTTTFLTMALNAGVRGVITLQGAPESHLGIVCREYGIPAVMSVAFSKGVRTSRSEIIPADGVRVRLDVSSRPYGTVSVEQGAPVDDTPAPADAAPAMSPEQLAQIQLLLEKFGGTVPHGVEGDEVMRAECSTRVLYADPDSLHRELTVAEVNEGIRYLTWNEWDALAARATEGESGLIPRQEYEAMGIMNCWFKHPEWLAAIEARVGPDGVMQIGSTGRREVGTKVNLLHIWALATAPSFGRGIALELNLHDVDYKADRIRQAFGTARRLYAGLWGEGPIFASMRGYSAPLLERSWVERFVADRIPLDNQQARSTFQRFNGAAELMGFLLHFDNRLGLADSGPYPVEGGYVVVRDLFVNEPAFPWSDATEGLPYAITIALFFDEGTELTTQVTDLSNVFTNPANYLPFVKAVAVYARETWDTPVANLRRLTLDDLARLRDVCEKQSAQLYARIAAMSKREKIEAGAIVYTAGFALPIARAAGMYDELVREHGFLEIHPAVRACYDTIISGVATEMIPRLFLTGSWGNPVPERASASLAASDAEFPVLHALRVRGFASEEQVAETAGLDVEPVRAVLAATTERGHARQRSGRVSGYALTPAGRARHVLLREDAVSAAQLGIVGQAYEKFLGPNQGFKQLTSEWQLTGGTVQPDLAKRLEAVHADATAVLDDAAHAVPRLANYRPRLQRALDSFLGGSADALAKPMSGSYHDIWMELHEDLLATLGKERTTADG